MGLFDKKKSGKTAAELKLNEIIKRTFDDVEFFEEQTDSGMYKWSLRWNSALIHIWVNTDYGSEEAPVAEVWSPCVIGARDDDKLYRFLIEAPNQSIFTNWTVLPDGNGKVNVIVSCPRSLNTLDDDELKEALIAVLNTADEIDDAIIQRFGGQRAQDMYEWED